MNYEPSFSKLTISEWQDIFEGLGYLKGLQDLEIYASQMSDENVSDDDKIGTILIRSKKCP